MNHAIQLINDLLPEMPGQVKSSQISFIGLSSQSQVKYRLLGDSDLSKRPSLLPIILLSISNSKNANGKDEANSNSNSLNAYEIDQTKLGLQSMLCCSLKKTQSYYINGNILSTE